ncbi:glycerophosphodiester phosphodiesterase domain-containing protein 4 isoform X4 [Rattus norvegicus]|uniref:glycerophosphodiester phosphodiesterase domain-containing protein 4 isoform X4 n=1 Tax=Rattus norvegicus TaxID=10116 RepID=UPI002FD81B99
MESGKSQNLDPVAAPGYRDGKKLDYTYLGKEQFFFLCLVTAFILSVLFLFVWVETSNEYNSFDWVVFLGTGCWFFWSILVLCAGGILTVYTSLLLLFGFLLLWERIELTLHTSHKVFIFLVIILCSFLLGVLNQFWKDKWLIAGLSLQIFAPFVHLSLITVMVIISWPLAICMAHLETEVKRRYMMDNYEHEILEKCNVFQRLRALQVTAGLSFLIILLCLYLMPLGIYSPCVLKKENLGPKPALFGHRGAPMLAPENTMMSFEKAVEFGVSGLETDIYVSVDHVPFLMHDYDLTRTTNIIEVLPSAASNHSSNFNWTFLSSLNAGQWFLKIFWLPGFDREYVKYMAPGFQHVGRLWSIEELTQKNISIINVDYKRLFYSGLRDYKKAKIYIHVYVINEPWLFSLAWCSNVNSVTTDNIELLSQLSHPLFFMTPGYYLLMWLFLDVASAIIIGVIFCYHWVKELRRERWLETTASADFERLNLPTENSEIQRTPHLPSKPPAQIGRSPWTPEVHYESSTRRGKNRTHTSQFVKAPKKKPVPFKNKVKPLTQGFQHTQESTTSQASLQTPQPTLKEDESPGPVIEDSSKKNHLTDITENIDISHRKPEVAPDSVNLTAKNKKEFQGKKPTTQKS